MDDTITIKAKIREVDDVTLPVPDTRVEIDVPSWLSGEPALAVALYFFGYAEAVRFVTDVEVLHG